MGVPSVPTVPTVRRGVSGSAVAPVERLDPAVLWTNVAGVSGTDVVLSVDATTDGARMFAILSYRGAGTGFPAPAGWERVIDQARSTTGRLQVFVRTASSEPFIVANWSCRPPRYKSVPSSPGIEYFQTTASPMITATTTKLITVSWKTAYG